VLSFGTASFGGGNEFFKAWGSTQVEEATKIVNLCLNAGVNLFIRLMYILIGATEEILGKAISGLRNIVLISTKATFPISDEINDYGSSAINLIKSCEAGLQRLVNDHIDTYHIHRFNTNILVEETLKVLDQLVQSGKCNTFPVPTFQVGI
jgi:aryl-alcohol dehydrogenase-like predicted oxidoreductase